MRKQSYVGGHGFESPDEVNVILGHRVLIMTTFTWKLMLFKKSLIMTKEMLIGTIVDQTY